MTHWANNYNNDTLRNLLQMTLYWAYNCYYRWHTQVIVIINDTDLIIVITMTHWGNCYYKWLADIIIVIITMIHWGNWWYKWHAELIVITDDTPSLSLLQMTHQAYCYYRWHTKLIQVIVITDDTLSLLLLQMTHWAVILILCTFFFIQYQVNPGYRQQTPLMGDLVFWIFFCFLVYTLVGIYVGFYNNYIIKWFTTNVLTTPFF